MARCPRNDARKRGSPLSSSSSLPPYTIAYLLRFRARGERESIGKGDKQSRTMSMFSVSSWQGRELDHLSTQTSMLHEEFCMYKLGLVAEGARKRCLFLSEVVLFSLQLTVCGGMSSHHAMFSCIAFVHIWETKNKKTKKKQKKKAMKVCSDLLHLLQNKNKSYRRPKRIPQNHLSRDLF